ncbi:MAG: ADYC domain-containing protein [Kofleriaceae bacterium]
MPSTLRVLATLAAVAILQSGCLMPSESEPQSDGLAELCSSNSAARLSRRCANNGMEENGPYLLGAYLDTIPGRTAAEHFSTSRFGIGPDGSAVLVTVTSGSVLTARILEGLILNGVGGQLRLHVAKASSTATMVSLEANTGAGWTTGPCGDGLAVAMSGIFQRNGLHLAASDRLTFACVDEGAAAKCLDFGYPPGMYWDQHQACTRMLRADTCSNGSSHTRAGTRIWFFDDVANNGIPDAVNEMNADPVMAWPPDPSAYFFEAIWRAGSSPTACLSKMRWQSLEIGALCDGDLPDPRDYPGLECEATSIQDAIDNGGAILFSKTQYSDLALGLWHATLPNGKVDYVTTVRGYHGGELPSVLPFHDAEPADLNFVFDRLDAMLMRVPPSSLPATDYARVATFKNTVTGSRVLTRADDPRFAGKPTYVEEFNEGYVLTAPRMGSASPLILYYNANRDDYVSSAVSPPAAGYVPVTPNAVIGYLAAPEARW